MTVFHDLVNTQTGVDAGFAYGEFAAQIRAAAASLGQSAVQVAQTHPTSMNVGASSAHLVYGDGTTLDLAYAGVTAKSITLSGFDLTSADGSWFDAKGTGTITANSTDPTAVNFSKFALTGIHFGNDIVEERLDGAIKLDSLSGAVSGKLSSFSMAWDHDNPATAGHESYYVKLSGQIGMTGSLDAGISGLSGKIVGFEWGTMTTNADGSASYSPIGGVSGLKMNAATVLSDLGAKGFDGLMAGLYAGNDAIDGSEGGDYINASTGNDKVYGDGGNDFIDGGAGNDQLFGGAGDDHIVGGAGNDKIADDSGNNIIEDTDGVAGIVTGWGNDTITTGAGNDKIVAGEGNNFVFAGAGNDNIVTGGGHDWINSGAGMDKILGGGGADVFVFDNIGGGKDLIGDFNAAEDILAFDTSVYTSLAGGVTADNLVIGKAALDANDFLIFDATGGKLFYDADGNGAGGAVEIANLKGVLAGMSAANFADVHALI